MRNTKNKKLNGKCRSCLGCGRLEEIGFKGTNYCEHYINDRSDKYKVWFWILIEVLVLIGMAYLVYLKISKLNGG